MVRNELGRSGADDPVVEAWIADRITLVSDLLPTEPWCNQPLEYDEATEVRTLIRGHDRIHLRYAPVWSVVSLSYRDDSFDDWTLIDPSEYALLERPTPDDLYAIRLLEPVAGRSYRVVVNLGWWPPSEVAADAPAGVSLVPRGLQAVALDMIAWDYDQRFDKRRGLTSESDSTGALSKGFVARSTKEAEWRRALAPYRRARGL